MGLESLGEKWWATSTSLERLVLLELKLPDAAKSKLAEPIPKLENNPSPGLPRKSAGELFCRRNPPSKELRSAAAAAAAAEEEEEPEPPNGLTEPILAVAAEEELSAVRSWVKHWLGFSGSSSSSSSRASSHVAGADRNRESPARLTPPPPPPPLLPPDVGCICFRPSPFESVSPSFCFVLFFFYF